VAATATATPADLTTVDEENFVIVVVVVVIVEKPEADISTGVETLKSVNDDPSTMSAPMVLPSTEVGGAWLRSTAVVAAMEMTGAATEALADARDDDLLIIIWLTCCCSRNRCWSRLASVAAIIA
jgi:hypothetical protein